LYYIVIIIVFHLQIGCLIVNFYCFIYFPIPDGLSSGRNLSLTGLDSHIYYFVFNMRKRIMGEISYFLIFFGCVGFIKFIGLSEFFPFFYELHFYENSTWFYSETFYFFYCFLLIWRIVIRFRNYWFIKILFLFTGFYFDEKINIIP